MQQILKKSKSNEYRTFLHTCENSYEEEMQDIATTTSPSQTISTSPIYIPNTKNYKMHESYLIQTRKRLLQQKLKQADKRFTVVNKRNSTIGITIWCVFCLFMVFWMISASVIPTPVTRGSFRRVTVVTRPPRSGTASRWNRETQQVEHVSWGSAARTRTETRWVSTTGEHRRVFVFIGGGLLFLFASGILCFIARKIIAQENVFSQNSLLLAGTIAGIIFSALLFYASSRLLLTSNFELYRVRTVVSLVLFVGSLLLFEKFYEKFYI